MYFLIHSFRILEFNLESVKIRTNCVAQQLYSTYC